MGKGLPSQAAGGAQLGIQAGNSAQGGALNAAGNARATNAAAGQGYSGAMQGNSSGASIMNQQYNNELQAWSANQAAAGAAWQGIGQLAGTAGMMAVSSKDYKTNKEKIKESAIESINKLNIEKWRYKEGIEDGGKDEHVGAYAEDFKRETGMGDGKSIPVGDALGVTMKAIQELDAKITRSLPELSEVKRKGKAKPKSKGTKL